MDKIKNRILKLLAVAAEGSGATGPERDTAKMLAEKLAKKYNLLNKDLQEKKAELPRSTAPPPRPRGAVVTVGRFSASFTDSTTGEDDVFSHFTFQWEMR